MEVIDAGTFNDTDIKVPREVCCCKSDLCNRSKESAEASFNGGKGKNDAPSTFLSLAALATIVAALV